MPIYRIYGTQYDSYEIWIEAEDGDADGATSITGLPFTSVDSDPT